MMTAPQHATHALRFTQLDREIPSLAGESIFQSARLNGVRIVGARGGRGNCGTCVVHVLDGSIERIGAARPKSGDANGALPGKMWVRACQVRALRLQSGDLTASPGASGARGRR